MVPASPTIAAALLPWFAGAAFGSEGRAPPPLQRFLKGLDGPGSSVFNGDGGGIGGGGNSSSARAGSASGGGASNSNDGGALVVHLVLVRRACLVGVLCANATCRQLMLERRLAIAPSHGMPVPSPPRVADQGTNTATEATGAPLHVSQPPQVSAASGVLLLLGHEGAGKTRSLSRLVADAPGGAFEALSGDEQVESTGSTSTHNEVRKFWSAHGQGPPPLAVAVATCSALDYSGFLSEESGDGCAPAAPLGSLLRRCLLGRCAAKQSSAAAVLQDAIRGSKRVHRKPRAKSEVPAAAAAPTEDNNIGAADYNGDDYDDDYDEDKFRGSFRETRASSFDLPQVKPTAAFLAAVAATMERRSLSTELVEVANRVLAPELMPHLWRLNRLLGTDLAQPPPRPTSPDIFSSSSSPPFSPGYSMRSQSNSASVSHSVDDNTVPARHGASSTAGATAASLSAVPAVNTNSHNTENNSAEESSEELQRIYEIMLADLIVAMGRVAVAPPPSSRIPVEVRQQEEKLKRERRDSLSLSSSDNSTVASPSIDLGDLFNSDHTSAAAAASADVPSSPQEVLDEKLPGEDRGSGLPGGGAGLLLVLDGAEHLDAAGWRVMEGIAERLNTERENYAEAMKTSDRSSNSSSDAATVGNEDDEPASVAPAPLPPPLLSRLLFVVAMRPLEANRPLFAPVPPAYLRLRRLSGDSASSTIGFSEATHTWAFPVVQTVGCRWRRLHAYVFGRYANKELVHIDVCLDENYMRNNLIIVVGSFFACAP